MTISTTTRTVTHNGNGVAVNFAYPFKIADQVDLLVYLKSGSVFVLQTLGTDYTVSGVGNSGGGTVSFTVAPAVDVGNVRFLRRTAKTQLADYITNDDFPAEVHEAALDKLTMALQDYSADVLTLDASGTYFDASGKVIKNLGGPTANQDAATKAYVDALLGGSAALSAAVIDEDLLLNVPADYTTVSAALLALKGKRILGNATVTIQVADGTYNLAQGIDLNHPDGECIRLLGNQSTPDNCVLMGTNPPTFNALSCTNGHKFGYVNGFKIDLAAKATLANNYSGIYAGTGSTIICGPKIKVNNWYYGINASYNSTIFCDYAQVSNAGDVGIWAFCGSQIQARYASSTGASDTVNGWGFGFQAEYGSQIECTGATATLCNIAGFAALSNSQVRALNTTSSSNTGSGFLARDEGQIENHNATATGNTRYGEEVSLGGLIVGGNKTLTGNTLADISGYAYLDNTPALGARIAANGPLRIDNNGTMPTYFNTSGGLQFEVFHTASSSSWMAVTGSSIGQPRIAANGGAADIDANIQGKGAGAVFLGSHRNNFIRINAAGAGSSPSIFPEGEADLDLILSGKGAGKVRFGVWTANADTPINGYITVKAYDGTTIKLGTIA